MLSSQASYLLFHSSVVPFHSIRQISKVAFVIDMRCLPSLAQGLKWYMMGNVSVPSKSISDQITVLKVLVHLMREAKSHTASYKALHTASWNPIYGLGWNVETHFVSFYFCFWAPVFIYFAAIQRLFAFEVLYPGGKVWLILLMEGINNINQTLRSIFVSANCKSRADCEKSIALHLADWNTRN